MSFAPSCLFFFLSTARLDVVASQCLALTWYENDFHISCSTHLEQIATYTQRSESKARNRDSHESWWAAVNVKVKLLGDRPPKILQVGLGNCSYISRSGFFHLFIPCRSRRSSSTCRLSLQFHLDMEADSESVGGQDHIGYRHNKGGCCWGRENKLFSPLMGCLSTQ